MSLILPHRLDIRRHTVIPYLWRIQCTCGYSAYAPTKWKARVCAQTHIEAEEPFPDLDFLSEPPPTDKP